MFNEKECNFKSAVDDKNITYITLLDNMTSSWIENRSTVEELANEYKNSIKWTFFFAIVIIASHIWFVFTGGGVWI